MRVTTKLCATLTGLAALGVSTAAIAQVRTAQPVIETSPGVWVSELDNPRPSTPIVLGPADEGLRAFQSGTQFSQTLNFEVEFYASPLASPQDDPYSQFDWFGERTTNYGLYRDTNEQALQWSYYGPGSTMWFESSSVLLGHGGQSLQWSKYFWDGSTMQRTFEPEQQWFLSGDTILVPVHVIEAYPTGGSPTYSQVEAQLLFDGITNFQSTRHTVPGGQLEDYLLRVTNQTVDAYRNYILRQVGQYYSPDDIFAQCGIQFRLASYVAVEVPTQIYEGRVASDWPDDPNCIMQYSTASPNSEACVVPWDRFTHGCSSGNLGVSDERKTAPQALRYLASQTARQNLITGQTFTEFPNGIDVILTASLDSAETAAGCPGPLYGLSDDNWAAVAGWIASNEPTTMSHEIGHILLASDDHPDPATGTQNLMKAGGGDGYYIPGCQTWERSGLTAPWNCDTSVVEPPGTTNQCESMRLRAASYGTSAATNPSPPAPMDMEGGPPGEKLEWSYGRAANGPTTDVSYASGNSTQGDEAIIVPGGFQEIGSPVFWTTDIQQIGTEIEVDVYIPVDVPNPYWVGSVALSFDHVATSTYSWIGQHELTSLPRGQWSTLTFTVPQIVANVLSGDHPNAQFIVTVNGPIGGAESLLLDGFRMSGTLTERTTGHVSGSSGIDVATNAFWSFENLAEWSSTAPTSLTNSPVTDQLNALAVDASGWTVISSRQFQGIDIPTTTGQLSLDIFIPNPQPNPWWVGDVRVAFDCPVAGLHNVEVQNVPLTNLFHDEYNHVVWDLPANIQAALNSGVSCTVSPIVNVSSGAGVFLIDRMGFE